MTLSSYKIKKIFTKWSNGKNIKEIAREEKVCPETVRRYLENNKDLSGYERGQSEQVIPKKKMGNKAKKLQPVKTLQDPSSEIDQACSRLEQMMQSEDNIRTTLIESDPFDQRNPNQAVVMRQLVDEIKSIHGQLDEFREELQKIQSRPKKE